MDDTVAGKPEEPTGLLPSGSAGTPEALGDLPGAAAPRPTQPRQAEGRSWRLLALVGVVGPLGYLVLVTVLGLLWDGYDPIRDTQSELGAVDSPYRLVMNVAGFMGVGVSILAFAAAYHRLLRPSLAKTLATGLLVVAGVGIVVVGSSRVMRVAWMSREPAGCTRSSACRGRSACRPRPCGRPWSSGPTGGSPRPGRSSRSGWGWSAWCWGR